MFANIVGVLVSLIVLMLVILWADKRWYKRHPGAEERFGQIDEDLERQGR